MEYEYIVDCRALNIPFGAREEAEPGQGGMVQAAPSHPVRR